jgi:hypothetical protein
MQRREFEEALIEALGISEAGLGAFRGRLRHFATLGVPNVPKRGTGNSITYRKEDLFTTLVALALHSLGFAPTTSAIIAEKAARNIELLHGEDEVFLIVANIPKYADPPGIELGVRGFGWLKNKSGGNTYSCIVVGAKHVGKIVTKTKTVACSLINLSERFRALPNDD